MVGGVETHLNSIIPEIALLGHETAFVCEVDEPRGRDRIALPAGVPSWCAAESGEAGVLSAVAGWRPDLVYVHKLGRPGFEARLLELAPAVFFAHDYYGTCISGLKAFKSPVTTPCDRRFGWRCLAHYYPHRCGGLNPLTMLKLYRLQSRRLELLRSYRAILTHSEHLKAEYIRHGIEPERVFNLSYYARESRPGAGDSPAELPGSEGAAAETEAPREAEGAGRPFRLLFVGRMDRLKGGQILLDALPLARALLGRPLRLVFAGDGPERGPWEKGARALCARHEGVEVEFAGWVRGAALDALLVSSDLLVVPSQWPEPFGLVGVEAGLRGVPAAAFAVGGIPTWLSDGVNGHLAPGDPPTPEGLAEAVAKSLRDPAAHARLRRGAFEKARHFNLESHLRALEEVFAHVLGEGRGAGSRPGAGASVPAGGDG